MTKFYNIVALFKSGKETILLDIDGNPRTWTDGKEAAKYAASLHHEGIKYQVRAGKPIDVNEWRKREESRLARKGAYTKVPWCDEKWVKKAKEAVDHFVHVSAQDPSKLAYTQDKNKGERDIQTRMAPSKYLQKYYANVISEATVRKWCAAYRKLYGSDYELKFAKTKKDIIRVYNDGPSSCMQGAESVAAYAGPDLAVAYIERKGKITARTVVWPAKKLYCSRVYGDNNLLEEVLNEEGYKPSSNFKGAKLRALKCVNPYDNDHYKRNGYNITREPYIRYSYKLPSVEMAERGFKYPTEDEKYIIIK